MKQSLVLSIFPGIDLLGRAFEEEGYCVVRGPDLLWGGEIKNFHPPVHKFAGVIGGPPCQFASRLRSVVMKRCGKLAENLIPEYERVVKEAQPEWFLMENVEGAALPKINNYIIQNVILNNRWLGEEQNRRRCFSFGTLFPVKQLVPDIALFENPEWSPAVCASGSTKPGAPKDRQTRLAYHGWKTMAALKVSLRLQGLPENFLEKAPFTLQGKHCVVGNGVPLPMGRAIAKAVKKALAELENVGLSAQERV